LKKNLAPSFALCAFLAALFMNGFVGAYWTLLNVSPPALYTLLSAGLAFIWAAIWWITEESKRKVSRPVHCGSVPLLTIAWPLVVGYYAIKRRGLSGLSLIFITLGVYLLGVFAAVLAFAAWS
jgi:hypothetical protein